MAKRGPKGPHRGNFKKGYDPKRIGNGRPQGKGLAQAIREETNDGYVLMEEMMNIVLKKGRGSKANDGDRIRASTWLADHAFIKMPQQIEHGGSDKKPIEFKELKEPQGILNIANIIRGSGVIIDRQLETVEDNGGQSGNQ